jgi:hypothetical protein
LVFTRQDKADINDVVKRATVFPVAALLLWATGIGDARNFDRVFNDQPFGACGLFESFDASHSSGTASWMGSD